MAQKDERDTMFARASYREGTSSYEDYYSRNAHLKELDDSIRSMPNLCSEGTKTYDSIISPMADAAFEFLGDIRKLSDKKPNTQKQIIDPLTITRRIKGLAKHYGACLVGVTESKDEHYYSHRGRHEEVYGLPVENKYNYSIAFAVEMKRDMILRSPLISEVLETSRAYVEVGIVGMILSYYIRSLGYEAFNNMDANYLVDSVAVAKDAGLGQVGRNSMLTNKTYGSIMRLGVVSTTLELAADSPIDFGLTEFCQQCDRCARNCLSGSISKAQTPPWQVKQESCYTKWRELGTDCGVCLASCPFGHGLQSIESIDNFKGNPKAIRSAIEQYEQQFGRRAMIKEAPEWLR